MNTQNDNHASASIDEPFDRLVDVGLMELVGGAAPPDLSARIAAAAIDTSSAQSVLSQPRGEARPTRWFFAAIAATLLVGGTTLFFMMPRLGARRAQVAARDKRLGQVRQETTQSLDRGALRVVRGTPAPPVASSDPLINDPTGQLINESNAALNPASQALPATTSPPALATGWPLARPESREVALLAGPSKPEQLSDVPGLATAEQATGPVALHAPIEQPQENRARMDRISVRGGQPAANSTLDVRKSKDSLTGGRFGVRSKEGDVAQLSSAPRTQLGPATDGTLDLYARGESGETGLQRGRGMPSLQRWKDQQEREALPYGPSGDQYAAIVENPFIKAEGGDAVSTFGIDVDTASYSNVRQFLLDMHQLPPANAVRIEELVNYFHYDYAGPKADDNTPFAAHVEVAGCPWNAEHRLARIAVKGREMQRDKRPQSNLVFLVDVSGSMNDPVRLPLVKYGLEQLTKELGENDHIAIVVYAGNTGVALPSTSGAKQDIILAALRKLEAGGSTAGGAGIQLAYQIAEENFIKGGTNRVILCTDGDFNVGTTNTDELQKLVATKAKDTGVFISTLGFGRGNLNDAMMVAISDHGNGNYHYIDNRTEARRVLVKEMTGTLVTIAKDVKIQVEFNPAKVAAYRLIGYEKRMLKTEDFNNDKKDAGEIGAGHTVTALYEIVPAGKTIEATPAVDDLKYQKPAEDAAAAQRKTLDAIHDIQRTLSADATNELLTLKMRYKAPDGDTSQKLEWPVTDGGNTFGNSTEDFRFAAAVAGFGMLLRDSQFKGDLTFKDVMTIAENSLGHDEGGCRSEFSEMVKEAQRLKVE
jgi:secreted protein with Ig-like and vWFA domain